MTALLICDKRRGAQRRHAHVLRMFVLYRKLLLSACYAGFTLQPNYFEVVISFFVLHQGCTIMGNWFSSIPDCSVEYCFHSLEIWKMLLPEDEARQVQNRK